MIKNQDKLIETIDNFKYLPHSILLIGEWGSGHEEICKYISKKFNLEIYNISEFISIDYINEINQCQTPSLYYVNLEEIGIREQNILLKLYEEPGPLTYIIINCDSSDSLLDTIKSRSYILKMEKYSKEYLTSLINDKDSIELISNICSTPGQIEIANHTNIKGLYELCSKILSSISNANFQNTLSISNKINFKDEYDKYDLRLFFNMLRYEYLEEVVNLNTTLNFDLYKEIVKTYKLIFSMNDKQKYFENFLINIWNIARG